MCVLRREEGGSADLVGTSEKDGRRKEREKTREVKWCRGRRGGGFFFLVRWKGVRGSWGRDTEK
jgi:hypothetical protein